MGDNMRTIKRIKQTLFLLLMLMGILIALYGTTKIQINLSNQEITKYFLASGNPYIDVDLNMTKKITSFISGFDIDNPITILKYNLILKQDDFSLLKKQTAYIEDPKYLINNKPVIYIYNNNQLENYKDQKNNIGTNVLMASYYLRDQLQNFDIDADVEATNFTNLYINNKDVYKIVQPTIKDRLIKYNDYLLIDIGRDIASYKKTTITYENNNLARFSFLVDSGNDKSIALAQTLSDRLNNLVPNISRGLVYDSNDIINNLSLSDKMIIVRCGGQNNSFEEVKLSLSYLAQAINNYLGETYGEI